MTVVLLQRKARPGVNFSVESYFAAVREILSTEVAVRVHTCSCYSRGVSRRLWLVLEAWWRSRGDVLHVTGDVRFLTYLLSRRRTLLTVLDVGFLERKRGLRRALLKLFWLTLPCRCVSYITVISEATKRELLRRSHSLRSESM